MATSDNLLNMTQNFMTPDILQKLSGSLGQPVDKIQSGLKSVLPAFLMGLVNKGTTTEGAQSIVNLVNKEGFDTPSTSGNLEDPNYLKKGSEAVNGIFGTNLASITSTLSSTTGMNSSSITKMLGFVAPVIMGVLGSKIKREGMNANGLKGFLGQQKSNLAGLLPTGIAGIFGGAAANVSSAASSATKSAKNVINRPRSSYASRIDSSHYAEKKRPWVLLGLIALVLLGFLWWLSARRTSERVAPAEISTTETTATDFVAAAPALTELSAFLSAGNETELPKRFSFQNLVFEAGTTNVGIDAQSEIDQIASAMKDHPGATARIEGFTDNTGNSVTNLDLSAARAESVKRELVNRGVEAGRIEAIGRGSESPLASNEEESGRAQNRRIEFVITNIR